MSDEIDDVIKKLESNLNRIERCFRNIISRFSIWLESNLNRIERKKKGTDRIPLNPVRIEP